MSPGWPTVLGAAALGAFAMEKGKESGMNDIVRGLSKTLGVIDGPGSSGRSLSTSAHGNQELEVLQGEVERLHKLLADVVRNKNSGGGYLVVQNGKSAFQVLFFPSVVAGLLLYTYARWRGFNVLDLFYVTRHSLSNFKEAVQQNLTQLWEEMRKQKNEFLEKISSIGRQQKEIIDQQQQLDLKLNRVDNNVDDIRSNTTQIGTRVELLDSRITDVTSHVVHATDGIRVLCAAVHDVCTRSGMNNAKTTQLLKSWASATPVTQTSQALPTTSGLRGLLESSGPEVPPVASITLPEHPPLVTSPSAPPALTKASSSTFRFFG